MSADSQLIVRDSRAMSQEPGQVTPLPIVTQAAAMMQMIAQAARDPAYSVEKMRELWTLKKEVEADEALKAFNQALAAFKANPPIVVKDLLNSQYKSKYVSLGNLVNTVNASLGAQGMSASWSFEQTDKTIAVTCVLEHLGGGRRSVTLAAPPDKAGAKNPLQEIKSTITYLEGATFQAVTGIVSQDANLDDDGNAAGAKAAPAKQEAAPEGFSNWWADYVAVADEGLAKLEKTWAACPKAFRLYANKWYGVDLARLKDKAASVAVQS